MRARVVIAGAVRNAEDLGSRKKDRVPACAGMTRARTGSVLRHFLQLVPNHPPERALQRSILFLHVGTQGFVNERLVITATLYPRPEPGEDLFIEANRDALLACIFGLSLHQSRDLFCPLGLAEIVFLAHGSTFVVPGLSRTGLAGGDDADHLLVLLCSNHQQDLVGVTAAQREIAGLILGVRVFEGAVERIEQGAHGVREIHPVLAEIGGPLGFVSLESHALIICT